MGDNSNMQAGTSICTAQITLHTLPYFFLKNLNYPFLFSPHPSLLLLLFLYCPHLLPSPAMPFRPVSSLAPPSFPFSALFFPSVSFLFSNTLPSLLGMCSSGASRLSGIGPLRSSAPSFFLAPFGQTELNRAPSFGHIWPNEELWPNKGPQFDHIWPNEGPSFSQTEPNKGPSFDLVWPNGAGRKGTLRADARKPKRGVERESICRSGRRVLRKRECNYPGPAAPTSLFRYKK